GGWPMSPSLFGAAPGAIVSPLHASAEDGRAIARPAACRKLATEIAPAVLPMGRGHHLGLASGARRLVGHRRAKAPRLSRQLRLAGLLEKNPDTGGVRDGGAAERHAMVGHEHRESTAQRARERAPLVLGGDQGHLVDMA